METNASAAHTLGSLRLRRGWIVALGIAQIIIGTIALGDTVAVTFISVMLVGWLLLVSAIVQVVHLVRHQAGSAAWQIVTIILDIITGLFLVTHPALGAITLTLVLAVFLIVTGVMRLVGAINTNLPHKAWIILNSIISILLGILLWVHWPWSGLWFIGFAIGIELILRGWTWVMLASLVKKAPAVDAPQAPA
jgi:uncharacterized membrane protein HdeD (DUF308 family)